MAKLKETKINNKLTLKNGDSSCNLEYSNENLSIDKKININNNLNVNGDINISTNEDGYIKIGNNSGGNYTESIGSSGITIPVSGIKTNSYSKYYIKLGDTESIFNKNTTSYNVILLNNYTNNYVTYYVVYLYNKDASGNPISIFASNNFDSNTKSFDVTSLADKGVALSVKYYNTTVAPQISDDNQLSIPDEDDFNSYDIATLEIINVNKDNNNYSGSILIGNSVISDSNSIAIGNGAMAGGDTVLSIRSNGAGLDVNKYGNLDLIGNNNLNNLVLSVNGTEKLSITTNITNDITLKFGDTIIDGTASSGNQAGTNIGDETGVFIITDKPTTNRKTYIVWRFTTDCPCWSSDGDCCIEKTGEIKIGTSTGNYLYKRIN